MNAKLLHGSKLDTLAQDSSQKFRTPTLSTNCTFTQLDEYVSEREIVDCFNVEAAGGAPADAVRARRVDCAQQHHEITIQNSNMKE